MSHIVIFDVSVTIFSNNYNCSNCPHMMFHTINVFYILLHYLVHKQNIALGDIRILRNEAILPQMSELIYPYHYILCQKE